jgi:hypothetical protein
MPECGVFEFVSKVDLQNVHIYGVAEKDTNQSNDYFSLVNCNDRP